MAFNSLIASLEKLDVTHQKRFCLL